jgi:hypothetical protein
MDNSFDGFLRAAALKGFKDLLFCDAARDFHGAI